MTARTPWNLFGGLMSMMNPKHDHYADFGWPADLEFTQLYRMYTRNGLASAGVDKTIARTWQDMPDLLETDTPKESKIEAEIRQHFANIRMWQSLAEADTRSMVGRYGGVILRFKDSKQLREPVDAGMRSIEDLVEVIPCWENQLTVTDWDLDETSPDFGKPKMFQFSETQIGDKKVAARNLTIHPDRVIVWSDDGTVDCRSALEPGYNDLIDAEKVKGAGGEGFWKSARGAFLLQAPEGQTPAQIAQGMNVPESEVVDKINTQMDDFQKGFDKSLLMGGMTPHPLEITLPNPEFFFANPVNSFAASLQIPVKILLGSQTGERASTEDANEWAQTCNSRRENRCLPLIAELVNRLVRFGLIPSRDWSIDWADLTEATAGERLERADKMSEVNARTTPGDEPTFTQDEIRDAAGYEPMETAIEGAEE